MKKRIDCLIEMLFDKQASIAERDDAAMDLAEFNNVLATEALLKVSRNKQEDEMILNSCGESLGSIWSRLGIFDEKTYRMMSATARYGTFIVIKARHPEWIEKYELDKDRFLD